MSTRPEGFFDLDKILLMDQQQALEIVDKIQVALEETNNTYIQTFKSIHQIESEIEQTTGQSIETIQLAFQLQPAIHAQLSGAANIAKNSFQG